MDPDHVTNNTTTTYPYGRRPPHHHLTDAQRNAGNFPVLEQSLNCARFIFLVSRFQDLLDLNGFHPPPPPSTLAEVFSLSRYFPAASALIPSLAGNASGLGLT